MASPKRPTTGRRVLRPLRRVGRLVTSRSRGPAVVPEDNYGALQSHAEMEDGSSTASRRHSIESLTTIHPSRPTHDELNDTVWGVERVLRNALLLLGAYALGVSQPQWLGIARHLLEWFGIAWITCAVILILSYIQTKTLPEEEETLPLLPQERSLVEDVEAPLPHVEEEQVGVPSTTQAHPALERFYMIDRFSNERIIANSPKLHVLENDLFTGTMVAMIRTPNVDDPTAPAGSAYNQQVSNYFRDKQRRFEYQYQVRLKRKPEGRIYFACEVEEAIELGMVQKMFVGASLAFCKKMHTSFHSSITGGKPQEDGKYEKVHVGFPVEVGFDRLVVTKPGDTPPTLGQVIDEDPELVKQRKKGIRTIDWNTQDTYTFAVWSAYVDFLQWGVLNLPGIRPFKLASCIGPQPMTLTLYIIMPPGVEKHHRCDMNIVAEIEMSNTEHTLLGPGAKKWAAKRSELILETSEPTYEEEGLVLPRPPSFEDDENEDEAQTVAELGEGMYLRSGDSVILQEGVPDSMDDVSFAGVLSNGGGFAVLQERGSSTIVIEKVGRGSQDRRSPSTSKNARTSLIKSGDKITIKLVTKSNNEHSDVKYLSIHRGWWLKWVSTAPTKNGFFTIHTQETEFNPLNGADRHASAETQTSYLALGGTFWLRHQRWSKYEVGVSAKQSPAYGGRMLGLYIPGSSSQVREEITNPDDEDDAQVLELDETESKRQNSWMRPLLLTAQKVSSVVAPVSKELSSLSPAASFQMSFSDSDLPIKLTAGNFRIDVPGWIEMANRTDRRRQLLYIVRITVYQNKEMEAEAGSSEKGSEDEISSISVVRLRNGNEIAELIRLGRALRREAPLQPTRKRAVSSEEVTTSRSYGEEVEVVLSPSKREEDFMGIPKSPSVGALNLEGSLVESNRALTPTGTASFDDDLLGMDDASNIDSDEEFFDSDDESGDSGVGAPQDLTPTSRRKRSRLIGSIARSVKTGTSKTGRKVVKGSMKVGKGTVRTGKAIIAPISRAPVHPKKPPVHEPKSAKRKAKRRNEGRDHYVVVNRTLKRWSSLKMIAAPPTFLAGQLAAADQSCRTASHILSGMCDEPETSDFSKRFIGALSAQIAKKSDFDTWFLEGGDIQMGVASKMDDAKLVHGCPVARWLWESHCREEWCGVYDSGIYCYAPLTNEPCLVLSFVDIQGVRRLKTDDCSPLPGFSLLAIDTPSRCHYFSLSSNEARDDLMHAVNTAVFSFSSQTESALMQGKGNDERDLKKARFWQGFQNSAESSLSGGKGKWAPVSCSSKSRQRTILNGRRMAFDIERADVDDNREYLRQTSQFVAELLSTSLSFSFESLEEDPDAFVKFHDATSKLRTISLNRIDLSSSEAVCIFINLYHCLLQHALLLTVNGPLYKRSANSFMRTTCYEIGGDVFSLAELNNCVIRGNLSRAVSPKPPYIDAPRKSNAYRFYALEKVDARLHFVLNTGDYSCPRTVPVLTPSRLQDQLDAFSSLFVQNQVSVDNAKRIIMLPRICAIYRNDFGNGDETVAVMFCVTFLDEQLREAVISLLKSESLYPIYVKHQPVSEHYHSYLKLWNDM